MARCEDGAFYNERGRVSFVCPADAEFQVVMDGQELLLVWCKKHMREHVADFLSRCPNVRIEPWSGE